MESQSRSTFVTVLAWIFIALSAFGTLIAILQSVMLATMFAEPDVARAFAGPMPPEMPAPLGLLMRHLPLFFVAFLLVSVATLVASIGLLRRWNWARLLFVGLLALGILWNVGGLVVNWSVIGAVQDTIGAPTTPGAPDPRSFLVAMLVASVLLTLAFAALFGWIIKRLLSPSIAAEFRRRRDAARA